MGQLKSAVWVKIASAPTRYQSSLFKRLMVRFSMGDANEVCLQWKIEPCAVSSFPIAILGLLDSPLPSQLFFWQADCGASPSRIGGNRHGEARIADSPEWANPAAFLGRLQRTVHLSSLARLVGPGKTVHIRYIHHDCAISQKLR